MDLARLVGTWETTKEYDQEYDEWYSGISSTFDVYVDGLDPGTEYAVNVQYNTSPTASGATWIGTEYVSTVGGGGGGGSRQPGE